ncbi:TetR family transcriptional regulator [Caballeronia cordobensis]|uniref:TetR family transcriptional regulator n=2 Tax=Caballeronia cordobensis TaxID=1353886 RepID=A0A158I6Y7_CABCO|nr:TetR family transcriptional regulator [Caballeronia cordobensis]
MLYYYFGSKERLYVAVLEAMYADYAKKESELDLAGLEPREAMATLATSIWAHLWDNPEWIGLINNENLHQGRYLKTSQEFSETISPVVEVVRSILVRGADAGQFRSGIDPLDFYVTVVGMGYYITSNRFTLSAFTGRDYARQSDRAKICELNLGILDAYLRSTT